MRIVFLDLRQDYVDHAAETRAAIDRVVQRGTFILGPETSAFEEEWARYCGCVGAAGVGNGTDAIALALLASGAIQKGRDEVITTPLTAGYTALGIVNAGGVPVYADIDPRTGNIDPASVERRITNRTCAIVPVHLYGQMADMPAISDIAKRHGLSVIEDAAHAHGARLHGRGPGSYGHAAAFSFYPTKNLGALGDGGAVVSNDEALIDRVKTLRQGAHRLAMTGEMHGRNSRLDEIQAAVLRVRLKYLDDSNAARRRLARKYDELLQDVRRIARLETTAEEAHVHHLYVVQHSERDRLRAHLAVQGIDTMIHYEWLLHEQPLFREQSSVSCPNAERVAAQLISLPLHPHLAETDAREVVHQIECYEALGANRDGAALRPDVGLIER
jgi:dTDP-4-amino-4,6-dideoxygalactose transaminase